VTFRLKRSNGSENILFSGCALSSGKWFVEVIFRGYYNYRLKQGSALGIIGPDYLPYLDGDSNLAEHSQAYLLDPLLKNVAHAGQYANYSAQYPSWSLQEVTIQMRIDMEARTLSYFQRVGKDAGLSLLTSFEGLSQTVIRPVIHLVGANSVSICTDRSVVKDGECEFKNLATTSPKQFSEPSRANKRRKDSTSNMVPTSSSGAACINVRAGDGALTACGGYASLVAACNPIRGERGSFYYEVHILELGGEGRGVLSPNRTLTAEGGKLTIGWAAAEFIGRTHNYKGVGDDRVSWGLRCADSHPWSYWSTTNSNASAKGPCFAYAGVPRPLQRDAVVSEYPPSSGRCITSGDVVGCSFSLEKQPCEFYVFRREKLLTSFEKQSKQNDKLRSRTF
jgi:hypothetical protein